MPRIAPEAMANPLAVAGWMFRALGHLFARYSLSKLTRLTDKIQCRGSIRCFLEVVWPWIPTCCWLNYNVRKVKKLKSGSEHTLRKKRKRKTSHTTRCWSSRLWFHRVDRLRPDRWRRWKDLGKAKSGPQTKGKKHLIPGHIKQMNASITT